MHLLCRRQGENHGRSLNACDSDEVGVKFRKGGGGALVPVALVLQA